MLVAQEKHAERYFRVNDTDEYRRVARAIVEERVKDGWFDLDDFLKDLARPVDRNDPDFYVFVLRERRDAEYEGFTIEPLEVIA